MTCICIIPARGGSQRISRKNIRKFHGKPIIAYSIETARRSGVFDEIYVSTDDKDIALMASAYGASVIYRGYTLSENDVGTQEVMKGALEGFRLSGRMPEYACCLYATAPMLLPETLADAYDMLIYKKIDDGAYDFPLDLDYVVPIATWLRDPGQFYFGRAEAFIGGVDLIGERTMMIKTDKNRECDINTEADWLMAEEMYKALQDG